MDIEFSIDFDRLWPSEQFLRKNSSLNLMALVNLIQEEGLINFVNFHETHNYYYLFFYAGHDEMLTVIRKNKDSYSLYLLNDSFFEPLPFGFEETGDYLISTIIPRSLNGLVNDNNISLPSNIKNDTSHFHLFKYKINNSNL